MGGAGEPYWFQDRPGEALAMIHVDDLGVTHTTNVAFQRLSHAGRVDCGSVMVPCPWFLEVAAMAVADPTLDVGVHLTLNAEKEYYRWRPLTRPSPASRLVDDDGFLPRTVQELATRAHPEAVETELRAQIDAALAAGIDVTHLDDHMGAIWAPPFFEVAVRLAREYRLPLLTPSSMEAFGPIHNLSGIDVSSIHAERLRRLGSHSLALAERIVETDWAAAGNGSNSWDRALGRVAPGLNLFLLHPELPGSIEDIEPATAACRMADTDYFLSEAAGRQLDKLPARRVTSRMLRERLRSGEGSSGLARRAGP